MATDTDALVRELEAAGVPTPQAEASYIWADDLWGGERRSIATDCDLLAPILVRHASAETRRLVLGELLEWQGRQPIPCAPEVPRADG
jgi:hypothetical protein